MLENEKILTVKNVMEILQTSKNKIYDLLESGELAGAKMGKNWRIRSSDLENFISTRFQPKTNTGGNSNVTK